MSNLYFAEIFELLEHLKYYIKKSKYFDSSETWFLIQFGQIEIEHLALFALQRLCSALIQHDLDCSIDLKFLFWLDLLP